MASAANGANAREGDWTCNSCGNNNYASRVACNRCSLPKMMGSGYGAAKTNTGQQRGSPYGAQQTAKLDGEGKPGDWNCPSCGNHNYAQRMACNRCKMPKMGAFNMTGMGMVPMMGGMMGGASQVRPGDWLCRACNNQNYASREVCNRCCIPKTVYISKTGLRDGDWLCPQCQNHNYASKTNCHKCARPKGSTPGHTPLNKSGANMREGDWICPQCSNHNYASKTLCNKCSVPKPF
eukprot:TRINITY_DN51217_c0_g1_i1.p1 TRINITY_DN51217_c0_g1~~TRINITY_DN51217_c0_g1_i1.p1  ORF type:complete len:254 (-),score=29.48 TRINITY_DN51217_c0_g1_i1:62-769(-)